MAEETRPTLPPGVLPNIFDTDPPPLHPATEVGNGYVRVNQEKLAETHKPTASAAPAASHPAAHTTTVTVTRTTAHPEPAGKH